MGNYNEALEIFKDLQKNGATEPQFKGAPAQSGPQIISGQIESLDEMVYGKPSAELDDGLAGQRRLNETLHEINSGQISEETRQRIQANLSTTKLDPAIVNSIVNNPLINENIGDSNIDNFIKKNIAKNKTILASQQINERLEKADAKKREEQMRQSGTAQASASVDTEALASLVESVIDRKMQEYLSQQQLKESQRQPSMQGIRAVQLKENGNFLMVDTDDNVFECTLTYKGKNKRRK